MKKLVLSVVTMGMVLGSVAHADGGVGSSRRSMTRENVPLSEFLCGLATGAAFGVVAHKTMKASDPVTFFAALIGGAIGYDFCKYLNDDVAQGLKQAADEGLEAKVCGTTRWVGSKYEGTITPLCESYHVQGPNANTGVQNECRFFEATVYERGSRKLIGSPRAWACRNSQNQWIVTNKNWVVESDKKPASCTTASGRWDGSTIGVGQNPPENGGTIDVGGRVPPPHYGGSIGVGRQNQCRYSTVGGGRTPWGIENLRRVINDYGIKRGYRILRSIDRPSEGEPGQFVINGMLQAISDDGQSVIMYQSPQIRPVVALADLGLECGVEPYICNVQTEVRTIKGGQYKREYRFLFQNGDLGVIDDWTGWSRIQDPACR